MPGDAHEVEADRAADAMVGGSPFSIGASTATSIDRVPDPNKPSYSNRSTNSAAPPGTGTDSETEAMQKEIDDKVAQLKATGFAKAGLMMAKAAGLNPDALKTAASYQMIAQRKCQPLMDQITNELAYRKDHKAPGNLGIDYPDAQGVVRTHHDQGELEQKLKDLRYESSMFAAITASASFVRETNKQVGEVMKMAAEVNKGIAAIDGKAFKKVDEVTSKVTLALDAIDFANEAIDMTAANAFAQNPSFDTALAWGQKVGAIFDKMRPISAAFKEIPGADTVVDGLLATPAHVIDAFAAVVQARYKHVDEMIGHVAPSQLLDEGAQGLPDVQGKD
jgi:hypothetical protein